MRKFLFTLLLKPAKLLLITLPVLFLPFIINAQQSYVTVDSAAILTVKGAYIYIPGNLNVHTNGKIHNEDSIYIKGDLINGEGALFESSSNLFIANENTPAVPSVGNVIFNGPIPQHINGLSEKITFSTITINNPWDVVLDTSVYVFNAMRLHGGSIHLNRNNISTFIGGTFKLNGGHIVGENNFFKISDTLTFLNELTISEDKGFIKSFYECSSCPTFYKSLGINLQAGGPIYIDRGHIPLSNAGDGGVRKFFKIKKASQSSQLNGNITVSYLDPSDYEGLGISEPDLRLFLQQNPDDLSQNNSLVEYTNWGGIIDTSLNTVTLNPGEIVNMPDTSIWTLADQDCKNPPIVELGPSLINVCQNTPFIIQDTITQNPYSTSVYYRWFANGTLVQSSGMFYNDTIAFPDTVNYRVKKFDNRGCYSWDSVTVICRPLPVAKIKPMKYFYCPGEQIQFTDSSTISDGSTLTHLWAFGDGFTTNTLNPLHSYSTPALYPCFHKVESQYGCEANVKFDIDIKPLPQVAFSAEQECKSRRVLFKNLTAAAETFSKAKWLFVSENDSVTLSANTDDDVLKDIDYTYLTPGQKTIQLTMLPSGGCPGQFQSEIVVIEPNIVQFTASNVCLGAPTIIKNTSVINSGTPAYSWDFGDTTTSVEKQPSKTYQSPGTYNIKLKLRTASCSDSITKTVYVNPLPVAGFVADNICAGNEITFSPEVIGPGNYSWNINGETFTVAQPVKLFNKPGTYAASLTVRSDSGCMAHSSKNFSVFAVPKANFTFQNVCLGNPVSFYNQSSVQGATLNYLWDFHNSSTSNNINPVYTFTDPAGIKKVKLVAVSNFGCADSITKDVEIYHLPYANMPAALSSCEGFLRLDATINDPRINVVSYNWSDGVKTPVNIVTSENTYTVTIKTDKGCTASESIKVTLNSRVDPKLPDYISFCGQGQLDALYPDANCVWSTGELFRQINVTQTGWYKVTVTLGACTAADSTYVTINPLPLVELGEDITACQGEIISLDAGTGFQSYKWSTAGTTPTINVTGTGNYKVTVTNVTGCEASDNINIVFNPSPIKALPKEITYCREVILNAGNNNAYFAWSNNANTQSIVANTTGTYWVKITNSFNCTITDTTNVTILPGAYINLGADFSICEGQNVTLNAGNNGPDYIYKWNGTNTSSPFFSVTKSGRYIVEAINSINGCVSGDTINVYYKTRPVVNLGNDRMLCNSDNLILDAGNQGSLIQWGSSVGLISTHQDITVKEPGKYWVMIMNNEGCIGYDTLTVYPSAGDMVAEFLSASNVKAGDTVHFVNVSSPKPYTSHWRFGDGVTSTENHPSHVFFIRDTFNVRLTISNGYCSATITKPIIVSGFKNIRIGRDANFNGQFIEILSSNLFPNPTTGNFTLTMQFSVKTDVTITLFDLKGTLYHAEIVKNVEELDKYYSFTRLPAGIYILKAGSGKVSKTYKIVKY